MCSPALFQNMLILCFHNIFVLCLYNLYAYTILLSTSKTSGMIWNWEPNAAQYANWSGFIQRLAARDIRMMVYLNPLLRNVSSIPGLAHYYFDDAMRLGYFVRSADGSGAIDRQCTRGFLADTASQNVGSSIGKMCFFTGFPRANVERIIFSRHDRFAAHS
jgi:hypothetical protein